MDYFTTDTEVCILCLENNKDLGKIIRVDSIKWQKENVQSIIEKYLWPIVSKTIFLQIKQFYMCDYTFLRTQFF